MAHPTKTLYVGTFRHVLDAKNRLTIPARWRFAGDEGADSYLALPQDGHLLVLPPLEIERLYDKLASKALGDTAAQASIQKLFSQAFSFGCDKQGRVALPEAMLRTVGIEKEAMCIGSLTKFTIWNPARWEQQNPTAAGENVEALMRRMDI
ncbi:MAG: mraZ [Opitutaceae bacterium]